MSTLSAHGKRGYSTLVGRYGEVIRRRFEKNNGKATARFYIKAKNTNNGRGYLVPVIYTTDLNKRTTELVLDEDRI